MQILIMLAALFVLAVFCAFLTVCKRDIEADFEAAEKEFLMRKHLEEFNRGMK